MGGTHIRLDSMQVLQKHLASITDSVRKGVSLIYVLLMYSWCLAKAAPVLALGGIIGIASGDPLDGDDEGFRTCH